MKPVFALVALMSVLPLRAQVPKPATAGSRLGILFQPVTVAAAAQGAEGTAAEGVSPVQVKQEIATTGETIVLPKFDVKETRLRIVDEELLTNEAVVRMAKKKYLSPVYQVTIGRIAAVAGLLLNPLGGWNPNAPEAMMLYEQDRRLRRIREMDELIELASIGNRKEAGELNKLRTSTFEGPLRPRAFPPGKR